MGSKIISFSRTSPAPASKADLEVYRDISLVADPNQANLVKTYKQVIPMAYLADEVTLLKTSYVSAGVQTPYDSLSSFLAQISGYHAGEWYIISRDPQFSATVCELTSAAGSIQISAGSQFLALSSFAAADITTVESFRDRALVKDYGSLSGRLLQGEVSSPSIPNDRMLLALQYADAYYETSYSSDLCASVTFLSGQNCATGDTAARKYVDDETRSKLMVLQDDGAVSTYAEWKSSKAWNPYKLSKLVNVDAVYSSLRNLFTWQPGERILDPAYGSNLRQYLYQGITEQTSEQIVAEIRRAIDEYEPRVQVQEVVDMSTAADTESNTIQLDIVFTIPSLSREQFHYTYTWRQTQ